MCDIELVTKVFKNRKVAIKGDVEESGRTFFRIDDEWLGRSFFLPASIEIFFHHFRTTESATLR